MTSDADGKVSIKLNAGTYKYTASDAFGNSVAGEFTIVKDADVDVAVAFR